MIRLLIKGDIYQARAALDARGLGTVMAMDPRGDCTEANVHDLDRDAVVAWFIEPVAAVKGQGFPPGALLLYREEGA